MLTTSKPCKVPNACELLLMQRRLIGKVTPYPYPSVVGLPRCKQRTKTSTGGWHEQIMLFTKQNLRVVIAVLPQKRYNIDHVSTMTRILRYICSQTCSQAARLPN